MKLLSTEQNSHALPVSGIILSGGASRRMGQVKALLSWGTSTLIDHTVAVLYPRLNPIVIIGHSTPTLPPGVIVATDDLPFPGPVHGLHKGLSLVPVSQPLFLTGCDFPFLQTSIVDFLLIRSEGYQAVVMERDGRRQPLIGLYQNLGDQVQRMIEQPGKCSMQLLLDQLKTLVIPEDDWRKIDPTGLLLTNVNTPDDYETAQQYGLRIIPDELV